MYLSSLIPLLLISLSFAQKLYILHPLANCGGICNSPVYDNIFNALAQAELDSQLENTQTYIFGFMPGIHYGLIKEITPFDTNDYTNNLNIVFNNSNLKFEFKPLYCNDLDFISVIQTGQACIYNDNENVQIKFKTETFSIAIYGYMNISNLVLDWSEDIQKYNDQNNPDLSTCLYSRIDCCAAVNGITPYSSTNFPSLNCKNYNQTFQIYNSSLNGLINIIYDGTNSGIFPKIIIMNSMIMNTNFLYTKSLICGNTNASHVKILNTKIMNVFFPLGTLIYTSLQGNNNNIQSISNNCLCCLSTSIVQNQCLKINLTNIQLVNYNPYNTTRLNIQNHEGYIIHIMLNNGLTAPFLGEIIIQNSNFSNMKSSLQSTCLPLNSFTFPFTRQPNNAFPNKTDLTIPLEGDNLRNFTSSSIIIQGGGGINGGNIINIINNTFMNIIGISGSVIIFNYSSTANTQNYQSSIQTQVIIKNNTFQGNFAFTGFATIRSVIQNQNFFDMIQCNNMIIDTNTFQNNHGCPGAYSNAAFFCYYPQNPSTITPINFNDFETNLNNTSSSNQYSILISNNNFTSNYLAYSNGVLVSGYINPQIINCSFQNNGVLLENFGLQFLSTSSFYGVNNSIPNTIIDFFTQTSPVFIQSSWMLSIIGNSFINNWELYTENSFFGSQITLYNIYTISNMTQIISNNFMNNIGIPNNIKSVLIDNLLQADSMNMPLITINNGLLIQIELSTGISLAQWKALSSTFVIIQNCTILNNSWSFLPNQAYKAYYNSSLVSSYLSYFGIIKTFSSQEILPGSQLMLSEYYASLQIVSCNFLNNQLSSFGFLISRTIFVSMNMISCTINNNHLYQTIDWTYSDPNLFYNNPYLDYVTLLESQISSFVCYNSFIPDSNLMINNSTITQNIGSFMSTIDDDSPATIESIILLNNTFQDNICDNSALFFFKNCITLQNIQSNYISNRLKMGVLAIRCTNYLAEYNTYIGNLGYHVAVQHFSNVTYGLETFALYMLNDVNVNYTQFHESLAMYAGMIFFISSTAIFNSTTFIQNYAYSGQFVAYSSTVNLYYTNIQNNTIYGISIIFQSFGFSQVIIMYSVISNNQLLKSNKFSSVVQGLLSGVSSIAVFNSCNITNNKVDNTLAFIYGSTIKLNMSDVRFINNTWVISNIGIDTYLIDIDVGFLNIFFSHFENNVKLMQLTKTQTFISNSTFKNNMGNQIDKNLIQTFFLEFSILSSIFIDSGLAPYETSGSFLYIFSSTKTSVISYCNFSNYFGYQGSSLQIVKGNASIDNNRFVNNSFSNSGSALYLDQAINVTISNCTFDGSSLPAAHIQSISTKILSIYRSSFTNMIQTPSISIKDTIYSFIIDGITVFHNENSMQMPNSLLKSSIILSENIQGFIQNSVFYNLVNSQSALNVISDINGSAIIIQNCTFQNNIGFQGAAVHVSFNADNTTVQIINSTFINNTAIYLNNFSQSINNLGQGGAIFTHTDQNLIVYLNITNCNFTQNSAGISGGAIAWDYYPPYIVPNQNIFVNNNAPYGPDISSYPCFLFVNTPSIIPILENFSVDWESNLMFFSESIQPNRIVLEANSPQNEDDVSLKLPSLHKVMVPIFQWNSGGSLNDAQSGIIASLDSLDFALIDIYGQVVQSANQSYLTIISDNSNHYSTNITQFPSINGIFYLNYIEFQFYPGKSLNGTISATSVSQLPPDIYAKYNLSKMFTTSINVTINFRNCLFGEQFIDEDNICKACKPGTYNLDLTLNSNQNCENCDIESTLCLGGTEFGPKNGYWRLNESASKFMKCLYEPACIGSPDNATKIVTYTGLCADNYQGNLCNTCGKLWGKVESTQECIPCQSDWFYYFSLFTILFIQVGLVVYSIYCTIIQQNQPLLNKTEIDWDLMKSNLMKILSNYQQFFAIIINFKFPWPSQLTNLFSTSEKIIPASSQTTFTPDCFIALNYTSQTIKPVFIKLIVFFSLPWILFLLIIFFWLVWFKCYKKPILYSREFKNKLVTTMVITIFNLQPQLITSAFTLFDCENLYRNDVPVYFLKSDYDFQCWTIDHSKWALVLGLMNILIWGIGVSFFVFCTLYKNKNYLQTPDLSQKFSFIYIGYTEKNFYWEFVIMIKKITGILILVFISNVSHSFQSLLALLVIMFSLRLQFKNSPYVYKELNNLEVHSIISSGIIDLCGLYFLTAMIDPVINYIVLIICIIGYLYFMVLWIIVFLKANIITSAKNPKIRQFLNKYKFFRNLLNQEIVETSETRIKSIGKNEETQHYQDSTVYATSEKSIIYKADEISYKVAYQNDAFEVETKVNDDSIDISKIKISEFSSKKSYEFQNLSS